MQVYGDLDIHKFATQVPKHLVLWVYSDYIPCYFFSLQWKIYESTFSRALKIEIIAVNSESKYDRNYFTRE